MRADASWDERAAYRALSSRDPRFDGVFYVGVSSTGVYCRPICPAKTPLRKNCRFFANAEAAEKAAFRPCLRCRPELAPGKAPVDQGQRIAQSIVRRMDEGLAGDGAGLEEVSAGFGLSSRQLRRIVQKELGVSPIELMLTRRLLLAKQLLTETSMPVIDVAFASGFSSLRRFNDAFRTQYRMPPTRLRLQVKQAVPDSATGGTASLQLTYRPPYAWPELLEFLRGRAIRGVEWVTSDAYARTVRLGTHTGWIRVTHAPAKRCLMVEFTHILAPVLPAMLGRLRNLFDLAAHPDLIAAHLRKDPRLRPGVVRCPGLRVPGAFDGFELAVRAVLGQQVTVKATTTLSGRFATAFGDKLQTPFPELTRLSPTPERVARASLDDIGRLGILRTRATAILALARGLRAGTLNLASGSEASQEKLLAMPGIGQWTASYIAMRASRWPDAFPTGDIGVRNHLGGVTTKQAEAIAEAWRPWRSYAVLHLWRGPVHKAAS